MKDLFLVTHAQSVHHVEHKVGGWHDSNLTAAGMEDAEALAQRLLSMTGGEEVEIFSSDLRRAAQTAQAIGTRFNRPVATTADLREISYGVAGGRPQQWLDARYVPAPDNDRLDHRPAIEGAESRRDVAERVYPCIEAIVARPCATQIIVTHGFTLGLVIAAWMKVPIDACGFMAFVAAPASITHLRQDGFFRSRAMLSFADTTHLANRSQQGRPSLP